MFAEIPLRASLVLKHLIAAATCRAPQLALSAYSRATTPAACGAAIDVPEKVPVDASEVAVAAVIPPPGAWMSTHGP